MSAENMQGEKVSLPPHTKPEQRGNPLEWCERCQLEAKLHGENPMSDPLNAAAPVVTTDVIEIAMRETLPNDVLKRIAPEGELCHAALAIADAIRKSPPSPRAWRTLPAYHALVDRLNICGSNHGYENGVMDLFADLDALCDAVANCGQAHA